MAQVKQDHQFGKIRPTGDGKFQVHVSTTQEKRDTHYRELPTPTGNAPFRLDLADVLPVESIDDINKSKKITFHINGDMGGIKFGVPQQLVAKGMEDDFVNGAKPSENPAFLYILGDCVYFNGQSSEYRAQFFDPYEHYLAPIFAVPGNHDGENLDGDSSLDGFMKFFCADCAKILPEAGDRKSTRLNSSH